MAAMSSNERSIVCNNGEMFVPMDCKTPITADLIASLLPESKPVINNTTKVPRRISNSLYHPNLNIGKKHSTKILAKAQYTYICTTGACADEFSFDNIQFAHLFKPKHIKKKSKHNLGPNDTYSFRVFSYFTLSIDYKAYDTEFKQIDSNWNYYTSNNNSDNNNDGDNNSSQSDTNESAVNNSSSVDSDHVNTDNDIAIISNYSNNGNINNINFIEQNSNDLQLESGGLLIRADIAYSMALYPTTMAVFEDYCALQFFKTIDYILFLLIPRDCGYLIGDYVNNINQKIRYRFDGQYSWFYLSEKY